MRTLILGGNGMLGQALAAAAANRRLPCRAPGREQADIRDAAAIVRWLDDFRPDLLVNCAALTDVDGCESRLHEAMAINGESAGRLAELAAARGVAFVQLSSDYIFDGRARSPYGESSATGPLSSYGASKLRGEEMVARAGEPLIVRTSWLFGPGGKNFVATIARLAQAEPELRVVDDQVGCPTYTLFLAEAILELAARRVRGIVHYSNRPAVSWCGFARAIVASLGAAVDVVPVDTAAFPRPARRPAYSVLDVTRTEALLGRPVEPWQRGLDAYLPTLARAVAT